VSCIARKSRRRNRPPHRISLLCLSALLLALAYGCHTRPSIEPLPSSANSAAASPATDIRFVDVAEHAGLRYRWKIAEPHPINILQGIGNGCAFLDFDGDGNLDILLIGPTLALYRGDGHGHFADVTHQAGLDQLQGTFLGCAVGDYDNDGFDDVYISAYRGGVLLHNERGQHFTDVTKAASIAPQPWGTSAAFVDIDNDGRLDLYIAGYVKFGPETKPQLCDAHGQMTVCGPRFYNPLKGVLYHNEGKGRFTDITERWGARNSSGKTLGIASADYDRSGSQSLFLANDEVAANLLVSGGRRYKDNGAVAGIAYLTDGNVYGGMGVDWGDYDNDGRFDLAVAAFQSEAKPIFHNDGRGLFTDRSADLGVGSVTAPYVAFGIKWLDADNDGWLDLLVANGHIQDNVAEIQKELTYRQPIQCLRNRQGTHFDDITATACTGESSRPIVGRGLSIGDYDNDGKVDALIVDSDGGPLLLHNETPRVGHWLTVRLVGSKSNRTGQGAVVTVRAGGRVFVRQCTTNGSYLSASDARVHFGLGDADTVESVVVQWPGSATQTFPGMRSDRIVTLREGASSAHQARSSG